jgi:WD40 repeat protein
MSAGTLLDMPRATPSSSSEGGHEGRVESASWLPEDDVLFVTGGDESVKIWDASDLQKCVVAMDLHAKVHSTCVIHSPKALAAAALGDATVRLIDLRTGRAVTTMQGHTAAVMCVSWGALGSNRLFSGGFDGTVRAWDVRMGARSLFLCDPYALQKNSPPLKCSSLNAEERQRNWSQAGRGNRNMTLADLSIQSSRCSRNPNKYLSTNNINYGHMARTHGTGPSHLANVTGAPASPPRRSAKDKLREGLWDEDAAKRARHAMEPPQREFQNEASIAHRGAVIALVLIPGTSVEGKSDGTLLSCGVDGKLRMWHASTGAPISQNFSALDVECWSKAVTLQLAVAGSPEDVCFLPEQDRISMRCLKTGDLLCGLAAHTQEVQCAVVLPNRGLLFTGGNDGRLLKWQLESKVPELSSESIIDLDVKEGEDISRLYSFKKPSDDVICVD